MTLGPSLTEPNPHEGDSGLRANFLVFGIEGKPDSYVEVEINSHTAPTSSVGTQARRGKAAKLKFQRKHRKYATAILAQLGTAGFQSPSIPQV